MKQITKRNYKIRAWKLLVALHTNGH